MRFKEFLYEEADVKHDNVKLAAEAFIQNCSEWGDIARPLYRLTDSEDRFLMRTRVPRRRTSNSQAGTRDVQEMIFEQPGWDKFPDRLHSIFCSTTQEFAIGDVDHEAENLVMIYPFDGTKIAMTTDAIDFNFINLIKINGINTTPVMDLKSIINYMWSTSIGRYSRDSNWKASLENLKNLWARNGKFDPEINEDLSERFDDMSNTDKKRLQFLVEEAPKAWTPEYLGCELVTPSTIQLPGKTRECWFSGKYLAIPNHRWRAFKDQVKELSNK